VLEAPSLTPFHRLIARAALARADRVTATGLRLAEATMRYMPPNAEVAVVPYGVDLERFRPQERDPRDGLIVGSVGRLAPEKGLRYLMEPWPGRKRAAERAPLARRRRPDDVLWNGWQRGWASSTAVDSRVGGSRRGARSSRGWTSSRCVDVGGFGVAAIEARRWKLPVVASNIHGILDAVEDGVTGVLVPPKNAARWRRHLTPAARPG
jgi:glycosyltransferase involved in cell wall biosynthesis